MWSIIIIVLLIFIYKYATWRVPVRATNREWLVAQKYSNKKEAAEFLDRLHTDMLKFMGYLKKKYRVDEYDGDWSKYTHQQRIVKSLITNYNPDTIIENDPSVSMDTAYTVNKGEAMYFCLRQREDPMKFNPYNAAMFAMLHEMTHIACYHLYAHPPDFWRTFKWVLQEAEMSGVYTPVDYSKVPTTYCGLKIQSNPYFM